jgi:beta-N-acetylhexosaminidase
MSSSVDHMTLDEQIGQLLMVGFHGTTPPSELVELIQQHHVGNIILFSRNIQQAEQVHELTCRLQDLARASGQRYPLLIAIDQENGMVRRLGDDATILPGNMALGAVGDEQSAYEVALACGRELKALGINLNLAPVVDVNNNPANPVIGVRSFSEDAQQVARLGCAQVRGYQDARIAACLKHFPGYGDTTTDAHLALPIIRHARERLEQLELVPFKSGITANAACIMSAHVYLPALMSDTQLPATFSPILIQQLLREQLGYQGVIITDCLEMRAISETVSMKKSALLAFQAGHDLLLISHRYDRQLAAIAAIKAAVQAGEISSEQIRQSAERIIKLKERLLGQSNEQPTNHPLAWVGCSEHQQLSRQIYERSTTLVRNNEQLLPLHLKPKQRLLVVYTHRDKWTQVEDQRYPHELLVEHLRQRHTNTRAMALTENIAPSEYEALDKAVEEANVILMLTINAFLDPRQSAIMQRLICTKRPVIGLAASSPYDLLAFPELGTYLVTYEYTRPAMATAVRVLLGEIQPQGKLPISLPGLYPRAY